ncbi:hypothetical protein NDU88_003820 [Pleurodeles waltl]|uniref:Uncharacterized protein n=1 Tax=Pleurodeles waltl TaxID=8319 RepID=A0AAV7VH24_PLEWA|nr:hypothetical protein NDU88_003820 [Pleurodeles waltl]
MRPNQQGTGMAAAGWVGHPDTWMSPRWVRGHTPSGRAIVMVRGRNTRLMCFPLQGPSHSEQHMHSPFWPNSGSAQGPAGSREQRAAPLVRCEVRAQTHGACGVARDEMVKRADRRRRCGTLRPRRQCKRIQALGIRAH